MSSPGPSASAQALVTSIQSKMRRLANEFASGEINREQFHRIYEHYQQQMNLAMAMLAEVEFESSKVEAGETIALRKQFTAMAKAAAVYFYETDTFLEKIGEFYLTLDQLAPILAGVVKRARDEESTDEEVQPMQQEWLLIVPGKYSAALMLFSNEPVARQIALVQNMHHDFEVANHAALQSGQTQAFKLVYPFQAFVRRSVTRSGPRPPR